MIVVDASVLLTALADDGAAGTRARNRLAPERLVAPELIDLEVASALRRFCAAGTLTEARADQALTDLRAIDLRRAPHRELVERCWHYRHHLTIYDAAYVALAEVTSTTLLTADKRLADAPTVACNIELLQ